MPNIDKSVEDNTLTIFRKVDTTKEKAIMQKRMAAFLLLRNCKLTNVGEDKKDPNRSIFFFEKGPLLDKALVKYRDYKESLIEMSRS